MKIAIHQRQGSYSDRWIDYCKKNNVPYKIVDCYKSDIIREIQNCNGIMWHWDLGDYKSNLFAKQFTLSVNHIGIKTFPDVNTSWHYDDKIGQKYLLEAINAPLVPTHIFYSRKAAEKWIESADFPIVFKLRGGASSVNVKLIKNKRQAERVIRKSFKSGFKNFNRYSFIKDRIRNLKKELNIKNSYLLVSSIGRLIIPSEIERMSKNEKGYVYFQDFIPNNSTDIRLVVVGDRCFGLIRNVRKGDFRASGSGSFEYDPRLFDIKCVKLAFEISRKLGGQSIAFDFVEHKGDYMLLEVSYCYLMGKAYDDCPGYWDNNLQWHPKMVNPQYFMIEDFINSLK